MRLLKHAAFALVVLAVPAAAAAQVNLYETPAPTPGLGVTGQLDYTGYKGSGWVYGSYVINAGYQGALGGDTFDMYCVDSNDESMDQLVFITPLWAAGDFTGTRYTYDASRDKYLQAAWLISNYTYDDPNSSTNAAIQGAIWSILGGPVPYSVAGIDTWITAAEENYTSVAMDRYAVLSGVNTSGQEFIVQTTATPEPATWLMLLTGLISVGGVGLRRKLT